MKPTTLRLALGTGFALLGLGAAEAAPVGGAVPAVGNNPAVAHDIISGVATRLKGFEVSSIPTGATYSGTTYSWDFGDGSPPTPPAAITAANRRNLSVTRTYTGAPGSPFNARLTLCDAAASCTTTTYRMVIRADSQEARTNIAIGEGLWYLHTKQSTTGQFVPDGSFNTSVASSAAAVNAFEAHGHLESQNPAVNPYSETVRRGLRYVFSTVTRGNTAPQNTATPGVQNNPDSNGNGFYLQAASPSIYTTGMVMDAIITSGDKNQIVPTGVAAGQTYGQAVQDMVDAYAMGQMDYQNPNRRGSWYYEFSSGFNGAGGHADNSSSGWAGIGMIPAEQNWGLTVPNFVKTENLISMQACYSGVGNECGTIGYGAIAEFGGNGCIWGCAATTPNGMVQLIMDGKGPGTIAFGTTPAFDRTARWLAENWGAGAAEGNWNLVTGYTYGMFATVKALRLAGIEFLPKDSNGCAGGGTDSQFDWFNDPVKGIAKVLITRQQGQAAGAGWGRWTTVGVTDISGIGTQWSLLMLATELFQQGPKAVAAANPVLVTINQNVTFSHNQSFHLDAAKDIVLYEWDLDNNGTYEFSSPNENATFSRSFPAVGTYTAKLRVTDNSATPLQDVAEVQVQVAVTNVPPVAVLTPANSVVLVGSTVTFDGSASFDPNAGAPLNDSVVEHAWDVDDSNGLVSFVVGGSTQAVTFNTVGTFQIALRVKDSGPGGSAQLTNVAFATITVDRDSDGDGTPDGGDGCPADPAKTAPGTCGCGVTDTDTDGDGTADCNDACADDPAKTVPGACGCGQADTDTDGDLSPDCVDGDDDNDGDPDGTDCDPLDAAINNLAAEICDDGVDNDCDGNADGSDSQCDNDGDGDPNDTDPDDDNDGVPDDGENTCGSDPLTPDNAAPTITCPADDTVPANAACKGSSNGTAVVQDVCEPVLASTSNGLGDQFPLGPTTVTHSVTDAGDSTASCEQVVTVVDQSAPSLTCAESRTVNTDPGACEATLSVAAPIVGDNCDDSVAIAGIPGDRFPGREGTLITYTATDDAGNSTQCTTTITVVDREAPALGCPATIEANTDGLNTCGALVDVKSAVSVEDNCDGMVALDAPGPTYYGVGTTAVTVQATDDDGNVSTCVISVIVTDTVNPVVACPQDVEITAAEDMCGQFVDLAPASGNDACGTVLVVDAVRGDNLGLDDPYPAGETTYVTYTLSDPNGNTATCQTAVRVVDTTAPTVDACATSVVQNAHPATCTASGSLESTFSDNCGVVTQTGNGAYTDALGSTLHTFTATDNAGNSTSCNATVTVLDVTAPSMTTSTSGLLWPPNHKYVRVSTSDCVVALSDACNAFAADQTTIDDVRITRVTSDELEDDKQDKGDGEKPPYNRGDGNTLNDIVIGAGSGYVDLRAERLGGGNGRVYNVHLSVSDAAGNRTAGICKVSVPHSMGNGNGGGPAIEDAVRYTVTP
jgi:hypothetical protein